MLVGHACDGFVRATGITRRWGDAPRVCHRPLHTAATAVDGNIHSPHVLLLGAVQFLPMA